MIKPMRVQRKRSKGWVMPENAVSVCRPGIFGNPFTVAPNFKPGAKVGGGQNYIAVPTIEDAIECYRIFLSDTPDLQEKVKRELKGKNLACWCKLSEKCHADVLLEVANGWAKS